MISRFSTLIYGSSLLAFGALSHAQSSGTLGGLMGGMDGRQMAPEYEEKAAALRSAPVQSYDFTKASLSDVLRFLATDAKINFISVDEESAEATKVVTFNISGSPFMVLETLCKAHGLALIPDNGMWYIRPADDRELVGKGYEIRFNSLEKVEKLTTKAGGASGGGGGGILNASVDLQGAQETFKVLPSELIRDIRMILDLPPEDDTEKTGGSAAGALGLGGLGGGPGAAAEAQDPTPGNELSATHRPKVLWKSDSNTLYVVATRLQHMWVEGYLLSADKQQAQIAIEVKFVETSHDPSKELGVDWSGTLGQNGSFWQAQERTFDPETGATSLKRELIPNTSGGFRGDLSHLWNQNDLNEPANEAFKFPLSVYSAQDISFKLRALLNDTDTKTTSYPRMVVSNNREAVFRSVVNQPVLGSASSVAGGGGAASTEQIQYLPIGTVLNILPKTMAEDRVNLNIGITVSSIIGEQIISGNPYPVATSRVYNAPVVVEDGYTVAISGLDEAREKQGQTGVPLLARIPLIKYAFSSKSRAKNHKNLMIFITPSIIDPRGGGLTPEPQSVVPRRPDAQMPKKPKIDASGQLAGGPDSVPGALAYLTREIQIIKNTIDEARQTEAESQKLTDMKKALNTIEQQVEQMIVQYPDKDALLSQALTDIKALSDQIGTLKALMFQKAYY